MKRLSTLLAAGSLALALVTPALAGSTGMARSYPIAQPNKQTIANLQHASEAAQREAREGNKNNPAFARKTDEIAQVERRLQSGQQVSQNEVNEALQPVWIW